MQHRILFQQFRDFVVVPTLDYLDLPNKEMATKLLLGTAAHETGLKYLKQVKGPALGPYQMEPITYFDLISRMEEIRKRSRSSEILWFSRLRDLMPFRDGRAGLGWPDPAYMAMNLQWATAVARLNYYLVPKPLPTTVEGLANYWKDYWCRGCKGTVEMWLEKYSKIGVS